MTDLLAELKWRGLVQDATPGLPERLAKGPITAYIGFDPTAPSLQVGNLVPTMLLAHLQRSGGRAIVLMGGGTGMIGDPSGKSEERPLLETSTLDSNVGTQERQFQHLLPGVEIVNNATWLRPLNLVEFLRDVGKHFTISVMLQKESVKARMQQGISYTEFSYMLIQAYDFWHLYREKNCEMQMGGSDQWGNITAGIELIRRRDGKDAHGLSAPLLTTSSGSKFGKTEGRAVWLDPQRTPPYVFYNFWVNSEDKDVEKFLRMFTFRSKQQIDELMASHSADPGARIPHRALAHDVTSWVHGEDEATKAQKDATNIFAAKKSGALEDIILSALEGLPIEPYRWKRSAPPRYEDLFIAAGLAASKSDARRLMAGHGLYFNENVEGVPEFGTAVPENLVANVGGQQYVLLRKGKKNYQALRIEFE